MEKQLICSLLRIYHSEKERFSYSKTVDAFIDIYNIGRKKGKSFIFTGHDKCEIAGLLLKGEGINAEETKADAWENLSRAESAKIGANEKLTSQKVRQYRVAIKALPGKPLLLSPTPIYLPEGANLDISFFDVASTCQHTSILVVENWETFAGIHKNIFSLDEAGDNPLVVFRGSPVYTIDNVIALLQALKLPVYAYVDYDPKGLCLALELPYFTRMIVPPEDLFLATLERAQNYERFKAQLAGCQQKLSNTHNQQINSLWKIMEPKGKALPQEYFQSFSGDINMVFS